ncbi:hypothetical protein ACOMHN_053427 [Nucella lapillus]
MSARGAARQPATRGAGGGMPACDWLTAGTRAGQASNGRRVEMSLVGQAGVMCGALEGQAVVSRGGHGGWTLALASVTSSRPLGVWLRPVWAVAGSGEVVVIRAFSQARCSVSRSLSAV